MSARDTSGDEYRTRYLKLKSALYDRTTGLPAFPVLLDRLRSLLEKRQAVGVLVVSIENLGLVESLYGWQIFDRILSRVAFACREARGAELGEEALLAVNGVAGERFVVFVPSQPDGREVDAAYLAKVGRSLRRRLEQAVGGDDFAGLAPRLSFRVGHSLLSHDPFYRFERRVYAAIDQAGSRDERRRSRRERSWNEELQKIIQERMLNTVFQPVVDLLTHDVLGHEALARGPKDTMFEAPSAMFAMSDQVGISEDLDRQCRRSALQASVGMSSRRKIFLNALPASLEHADWQQKGLIEELREVLLEPQDLVLEFSDRAADEGADRFVDALERLREHGFGVALDDLGTGYASQAVLERARPDYLKLDVSLVRDIDANMIKQELLHSLVRIAARIGAAVIAEGVETEAEALTLVESGAQYGQGYLFAGPAPADSVEH